MLSHFNLAGDWTAIAQVCEPRPLAPPIHREAAEPDPDLEPEAGSDELDDGPVAQLGGAGEGLGGVGAH